MAHYPSMDRRDQWHVEQAFDALSTVQRHLACVHDRPKDVESALRHVTLALTHLENELFLPDANGVSFACRGNLS